VQISKEQQLGNKADWFVRDVNISNEQTIFLANKQQLLDIEQFCTNPERFSFFSVDATFNVAMYFLHLLRTENLLLETNQGVNPICTGPGVLHTKIGAFALYSLCSHCKIPPNYIRCPCGSHGWSGEFMESDV
jgi:hypothetical protein